MCLMSGSCWAALVMSVDTLSTVNRIRERCRGKMEESCYDAELS